MLEIYHGQKNRTINQLKRNKALSDEYKGINFGKSDKSVQGKVFYVGDNMVMVGEDGYIQVLKCQSTFFEIN